MHPVINNLQLLARSDKPLVSAADNTIASKLEPGQRIQATIQAQLNPGVYKVQVAGQIMQMQLPGQPKVGSLVELRVESVDPRLTFSLLASTSPTATREAISSTSRLLSNLAELPLSKTFIQSASGRAVWQATGTAPEGMQLAGALKEALVNSGLFYESHQAQWVSGERSTAQLLVEPQNQLDKQAATPEMQQGKPSAASGLPIARELIPLVQQQLHALETHQLTWTGQIWPGQQMQWEIHGQPEHQSQQPDARQWSTEMELALPHLGDVHARLTFSQGKIKLKLNAADTSSVEKLKSSLPSLARTLTDAGVPMIAAVVEKS